MKKYERNNEISRNFPALKCISSDKTIDLIKYLQDWRRITNFFKRRGMFELIADLILRHILSSTLWTSRRCGSGRASTEMN